MGVTDFH